MRQADLGWVETLPSSLIDGTEHPGGTPFDVVDKYSGTVIGVMRAATLDQVEAAVACVERGFGTGFQEPGILADVMDKAAGLLEQKRQFFADLMVAETGFTHPDVNADIDRTMVTLRLSAQEATRIAGEMVPFAATPGQHRRLGFTIRVPRGVVCAITPFNSPLNVVAHKVAPALAAGNGVVLKPSGLTPFTASAFCMLLLEAGLRPDALSLVNGLDGSVGTWLLEDSRVAFYSFTGSTRVGRIIQAGAGLRPTQLELGSIASTLVCADADLDLAVSKISAGGFRKAGQVCTSVQRAYVARDVMDEFAHRLAERARSMTTGDPRDEATRVGPMIAKATAAVALQKVVQAREGGATVLAGGTRDRSLFEPTVVAGTRPGMRLYDEEVFAPIITLHPFDAIQEAVSGANDTPFGLSAGIFTCDVGKALHAARALRFGAVHINETSSARADGMPFGGVKDSGHGFEGPRYAIRELTEERLITFNV